MLSGQEFHHFLNDKLEISLQLISDEVSDCTKYLMDMFPSFRIMRNLTFGKFFNRPPPSPSPVYGGFSLIILVLGKVNCFFLKVLKTIIFWMFVPNLLFRNCLWCLLLKFKIEPSLGFSCLNGRTWKKHP